MLNLSAPMYARAHGPATLGDFLADPCGFIEGTGNRIAESDPSAGGVRIHATDDEFLGPLVFVQGPGPGARVAHASWIGRMHILVNGG